MTEAEIEALAVKHEAFGFGRVDANGYTTHGFDPDGLAAFVRAITEEAVRLERAQSRKLADALLELLNDTQHKNHPSCDDGGYCPVRDAREALAEFDDRIRSRSKEGS